LIVRQSNSASRGVSVPAALLVFNMQPTKILLGDQEGYKRIPFDVKLTFIVAILLFYPVALCFLLDSHPSVDFWVGKYMMWLGVAVISWIIVCHFLMVRRAIKPNMAAIFMIIIPTTALVIGSQTQAGAFKGISSLLQAQDCRSFPRKLELQESWFVAQTFFEQCIVQMANSTGSSVTQTWQVTPVSSCPGYELAMEGHKKEWNYLATLEQEHHCGGWCTSALPIWVKHDIPQDSCSLTAARLFKSSIDREGLQLAVYSGVLLICTSFTLLLFPSVLGATKA